MESSSEAMFRRLILLHNARKVTVHQLTSAPKDRAVWYETRNFGWLLSAVQHNGKKEAPR